MEKRIVGYGDWVTLHYRLRGANGKEIAGTFGGEPLTLLVGGRELAENLEKRLVGLEKGEHRIFRLGPEQAFGYSDPALIQEIPLETFPPDAPPEENSLMEFTLPSGETMTGTVKGRTATHATVDFNHPLSDLPVEFEVEVLGIEGG
jgi:FKBP-type peptidyl-prolyl cis-trans isomerase 2